ncbi:hypothetical protein JG687_00015819 [Phytophthora cactorum]|uniref:Uncharacterized protein n=1 Tax=Phytophthora cactorum TaxID=29920 RepID=A0A8T1TVW3_9STRA|nr:hypothetical protein GQ600_11681 [Phytophthora cactorum]KAG6947877.1 hypothetical protein JG687_00015819 [Phytophthora cactorum]
MDAFETVATTAVITGRTSTSSDPLNEDNINLRDDKGSANDCLIRKSNAYQSSSNWTNVIEMFPNLFPGGCGGPDEKWARKLSLRKWILRCFRLPAALVAGNISRETILQAVQYYKYLTESQAHGVQPTPPPDAIKEIFDL